MFFNVGNGHATYGQKKLNPEKKKQLVEIGSSNTKQETTTKPERIDISMGKADDSDNDFESF